MNAGHTNTFDVYYLIHIFNCDLPTLREEFTRFTTPLQTLRALTEIRLSGRNDRLNALLVNEVNTHWQAYAEDPAATLEDDRYAAELHQYQQS